MKKILLLLVFSLLLFLSCTRNCPDDVKIGSVELSGKSLEYFPYQNSQTIVFKDDTGSELKFTSPNGVQADHNRIAIHKTCSEFRFDGGSSFEYFEGTTKGIVFFNQERTMVINVGLVTKTLKPETKLFYDMLTIGIANVGTIGRFELVTDVRFSESYQESDFYIVDPAEHIDQITLNEKTYSDVYQSVDFDGRQMYYTKSQGIVGFKTTEKTYNLDRIE